MNGWKCPECKKVVSMNAFSTKGRDREFDLVFTCPQCGLTIKAIFPARDFHRSEELAGRMIGGGAPC